MAETRVEVPLLIAFVDLTRFAAQCQRIDDRPIADTLDAYYELVAAAVESGGGTVVKFIGDAALIVFPAGAVDRGVLVLLTLKDFVDAMMAQREWECRLIVKAHYGTVIAGPFGASGDKRYDVIGKAVNATAMLDSTGVTLSAEAFGKLGRDMQARFKQGTSVTYIRVQDPTGPRTLGTPA